MEISVFPRSFTVAPGMAGSTKGQVPVMHVVVQDSGGTVVKITFGLDDWAGFQAYVADFEEAARSAAARAVLLGPGGRAPTLKTGPH